MTSKDVSLISWVEAKAATVKHSITEWGAGYEKALQEVLQHLRLRGETFVCREHLSTPHGACPDCARAARETRDDWRPIATAPKGQSVMLVAPYGLIYCGRERYGELGEPQQEQFAWRCDSSGRYSDPTHWRTLPSPPKTGDECGS